MVSRYHDRKMLKWLPFDALETHGETIKSLYRERELTEKPLLSEDTLVQMQYTLETAYMQQQTLRFTVYDNGRTRAYAGVIVGYDPQAGMILLETATLAADAIVAIEVI